MTVHFDTLEITETLTAAGKSPEQGEAITRTNARAPDTVVTSEIATKADLKVLRVGALDVITPLSRCIR